VRRSRREELIQTMTSNSLALSHTWHVPGMPPVSSRYSYATTGRSRASLTSEPLTLRHHVHARMRMRVGKRERSTATSHVHPSLPSRNQSALRHARHWAS
jgi:hypothetical protein